MWLSKRRAGTMCWYNRFLIPALDISWGDILLLSLVWSCQLSPSWSTFQGFLNIRLRYGRLDEDIYLLFCLFQTVQQEIDRISM